MEQIDRSSFSRAVTAKNGLFIILVSSAFIIGSHFRGFFEDDGPKEATVQETVTHGSMSSIKLAWGCNKALIRAMLKDPSSAEFPSFFSAPDHVAYLGDKTYRVRSWVLTQDPSGAMTRQNYVSTVRMEGSDSHWVIENVEFH
jgi:hypothetical protein